MITMYRGDTLPEVTIACTGVNESGATVDADLSGATEVRVIASQNRALLFSRTLVERPVDGELTFEWEAGDTEATGIITLEVQVTWSPDRVLTFRAPEPVHVVADIR